jgi:hypothetical protein
MFAGRKYNYKNASWIAHPLDLIAQRKFSKMSTGTEWYLYLVGKDDGTGFTNGKGRGQLNWNILTYWLQCGFPYLDKISIVSL